LSTRHPFRLSGIRRFPIDLPIPPSDNPALHSSPDKESQSMRRLSLLFAVLVVVLLLGSDSPRDYDDKVKIVDEVDGTWKLIWIEYGGLIAGCRKDLVMNCSKGTYIVNYGGVEEERGCYRIEPTRKPPQFDYTPSNGEHQSQTSRCIYEIQGDTLKIVEMPLWGDTRRPQGFKDKGVRILNYKRIK
jgi:uncharacterized protein (TIGR03067 family)